MRCALDLSPGAFVETDFFPTGIPPNRKIDFNAVGGFDFVFVEKFSSDAAEVYIDDVVVDAYDPEGAPTKTAGGVSMKTRKTAQQMAGASTMTNHADRLP